MAARRARHHRAAPPRSRRSRASVPDSGGVIVVPALAGLGAPHWRPEARGLITGLTRGTTAAHLARADARGHRAADRRPPAARCRRDAGRAARARSRSTAARRPTICSCSSRRTCSACEIVRPALVETTALGAAFLAGLGAGVWKDTERRGARLEGRAPLQAADGGGAGRGAQAALEGRRRARLAARPFVFGGDTAGLDRGGREGVLTPVSWCPLAHALRRMQVWTPQRPIGFLTNNAARGARYCLCVTDSAPARVGSATAPSHDVRRSTRQRSQGRGPRGVPTA